MKHRNIIESSLLNEKQKNNLNLILKVFFIGLLLQFVLQVFVTFQIGRTGGVWSIIWAWKEILIGGLGVWVIIYLLKHKRLHGFLEQFPAKKFFYIFLMTFVVVAIVTLFFSHSGLKLFLMSVRYTFSGFFIFLVFFALARLFLGESEDKHKKHKYNKILYWYGHVIKWLLVLGIIRWGVIWLAPKTMNFIGYNHQNFEGTVGQRPPVTYYTQLNQGFVRNQFIFERPISRGFFLIALRPLFFMYMVKNKGSKNIFMRGGLYGLNVFSTFSRAAWGVRIFTTFFLLLFQYRKQFWKLSIYLFLPLVLLFVGAIYVGRDQIIAREYSNTGHKELVLEAIEKIKAKPIFGQGAGTAGPVTHQVDTIAEYNPENQFLQIWIEYGVFGFIGRMWMFVWLLGLGIPAYKVMLNKKYSKFQRHTARVLFACALGLLGLAGEGMVLHSFIDRMIVYPFMAIFAIAYASFLYANPRILNNQKS